MLDLAIIGAGVMGSNHGRVAMGLRDAKVKFVVDPDVERGQRLAEAVGARHVCDVDDVIGEVDAAIVAAPTRDHRDIGVRLLESGLDVLLEKPIADSTEDALALVAAAETHGQILMVGHVERFNPAVLELENIAEQPVHVDTARIGPFSARVNDNVVIDLMVHDIDIVCALIDGENPQIEAIGRTILTKEPDIATSLMRFDNGQTATLTASRIGQHKIRRIEVTEVDSFIAVDLLKQTIMIQRASNNTFGGEGRYRQQSTIEIPYLSNHGEPLYLEQAHFVESVLSRKAPKVGGVDGLRALELALEIRKKIV